MVMMLIMNKGKRETTEGIELPNQENIKTLGENESYKYLGILEADMIKQRGMKDKVKKENLKRTRKLLETQLYSRNLIKGMNIWAVSLVRYLRCLLNWSREELRNIDQRMRKLMTIQ